MALLTLKEASLWASRYLNKQITVSNISYLIQYGKIRKYIDAGTTTVDKTELINYYKQFTDQREASWREKLGSDLNRALSFEHLKEKETTKHVHRLHPYKGKFIPQLVAYFIGSHIDHFKTESCFKKGNIILDPFSGSGTALVQANESGLHAIGIDISIFNVLITDVKVGRVDFQNLDEAIKKMTASLKTFTLNNNNILFEKELLEELALFNKQYFPSPDYKIKVRQKEIIEREYATEKENVFIKIFDTLQKKYNLNLKQDKSTLFLENWYLEPIRKEIYFMFEQLKVIEDQATKKNLTVILSRTIRSCRATTHADLATLKKPVTKTYYCRKHGKICKPLFSILSWWERYSKDTVKRFHEFEQLRTDTYQKCLQGDARNIDIFAALLAEKPEFGALAKKQKIAGIFSSPPYIGLIDYHEQHAYAYDLFGFKRHDELEIGPLFKGQGKAARHDYIAGVSQVLNNAKQYLQDDYNVFLVANDKYNLYPTIAEKSQMRLVKQYKRPVLNRTEKDKSAYAEIVFHLKEKQ